MGDMVNLLNLLSLVSICFVGVSEAVSHVTLYRDLPSGADNPAKFNIRSNYEGSVTFVEATDFAILVNVTAPSVEQLSAIHHSYESHDGVVFLQVYEGVAAELDGTLNAILLVILLSCFATFIITAIAIHCWHKRKKYRVELEADRATDNADESRTPLMDHTGSLPNGNIPGRISTADQASSMKTSSQQSSLKNKKKKKKRPSHNSGESSTEEEEFPRPVRKPAVNDQPRGRRKEVVVIRHPALSRCQDQPTVAPCASGEGTGVSSGDEAKSSVSGYGTMAMGDALNTSGEKMPPSGQSPRHKSFGGGSSSQDDVEWDVPAPDRTNSTIYETDDRQSDYGEAFTMQLQNSLPRKVDVRLSTFSPAQTTRRSVGDEDEDWPLPPPVAFQSSDLFSPKSLQNMTKPLHGDGNESVSTRSSTNSSAVTVVEAGKSSDRGSRGDSPDSPLDDGYETAITRAHSNEIEPENNNKSGSLNHRKNNGGGPNFHLAMISVLSVLCLAGGVYSQTVTPTQVHITVFLPPGFADGTNTSIYFMANATAEHKNGIDDFPIKVYEVEDAYLPDMNNLVTCQDCDQGCDAKSGKCLCRRGFRLYGSTKCTNQLECLLLPCDKNARCVDSVGSYSCECRDGFYGDGTVCSPCENTCSKGFYRVKSCPDKLCKECSQACPAGSYITSRCTETRDLVCTECEGKCTKKQFEFSPCSNYTERQCRGIVELPKPEMSANVIHEDRKLLVRDSEDSSYYTRGALTDGDARIYTMDRGTGLSIKVKMEKSSILPLFVAVNHSMDSENDKFLGDQRIPNKYCPFPVPDMYELRLITHNDKTSAYVDPSQDVEVKPCETYKTFGSIPRTDDGESSFFCQQANPLTDRFGISASVLDETTVFVEPLSKCSRDLAQCDTCIKKCANGITRKRDGWCGLATDDSDDKQSPRLQQCYDCCVQTNCTYTCKNYAQDDCEHVRCRRGKIVEFVLRPMHHESSTKFVCHVQPMIAEYWYKFSYDLVNDNTMMKKTKMITKAHLPEHVTTKFSREGIFEISILSGLNVLPDVVSGSTDITDADSRVDIYAGHYEPNGSPLTSQPSLTNPIYVRPDKPFSMNTNLWKMPGCNEDKISKLRVKVGDAFGGPNTLKAAYITQTSDGYPMYDVSNSKQTPLVKFKIRRNESILHHMYGDGIIKEDDMKATIERDFSKWTIKVAGSLESCPGYIHLRLLDDNYPFNPLFDYDMGIDCPKNFNVMFNIPTTSKMSYERRMTLSVRDSKKVVVKKLLWTPGIPKNKQKVVADEWERDSNWIKNKVTQPVNSDTEEDEESSVSLTFVVAVCGFVLLFIILWTLGYLSRDDSYPPPNESKLKWSVLLTLFYTVFWTAYSLAMTFTVFILLWGAINRESFMKLSQYPAYASTVNSLQRLDLYNLQQYVSLEMKRQNDKSNINKESCQAFMAKLQGLALEVRYNMSKMAVASDIPQKKIKEVYDNAQKSVDEFQTRLTNFRTKFNSYAKNFGNKILTDIRQTAFDIETNRWLTEPRTVRNAVYQLRSSPDSSTTEFLEWLGIRTKIENMKADFTLKDFPLPNRTEFEMPKFDPAPPSDEDILSSYQLPKSKIHIQQVSAPVQQRFNPSSDLPDDVFKTPNSLKEKPKLALFNWTVVITMAIVLDILWLLHRLARCVKTVERFLCGWPCLVDCRHQGEGAGDKKKCCKGMRSVFQQVMKTDFIPKFLATAFISCLITMIITATNVAVNLKTLHQIGYFTTVTRPIDLSFQAAYMVVDSHSQRINQVDNMLYKNLYKTHLQYYDALRLNVRQQLGCKERYTCVLDLPYLDTSDECNMDSMSPQSIKIPRLVTSDHLELLVQPYVDAFKTLVSATCNQLLVYMGILVLVNLASSVGTMYIQRFRGIKQKIVYVVEKQVEAVPTHIQFEAQ